MDQDKAVFIRMSFPKLVERLSPDTPALWGKMNVQQTIEHVTGFFKVSTNQLHFPLVTPEEHLPKFKEFLLSDKQFRENTQAPVLPEEPLPVQERDLSTAVTKMKQSIEEFFHYFEADTSLKTTHPVFGPLNFDEWVLLHYKHVTHHARQFGLLPR